VAYTGELPPLPDCDIETPDGWEWSQQAIEDYARQAIAGYLAKVGQSDASTLTYWADKIDPLTRKEAPDHLTLASVAQYLRGAQPASEPVSHPKTETQPQANTGAGSVSPQQTDHTALLRLIRARLSNIGVVGTYPVTGQETVIRDSVLEMFDRSVKEALNVKS
jgi:hypothetical protein